ncbi:MAG: single-stranded DNA-binding protein [Oscillibacter sp.]|nr:single-stranded DNA-binding protein [Oscillibacter sp.]
MTTKNEVLLEGTVLAEPEWSHENHGTQFFRIFLQVPRLSGQVDLLPVLLPGALVVQAVPGRILRVRGQLRSFNNRSGVGSRLVLTVYAQELQPGLDEPCNQITLLGALCKPPVFRRTPLGRSICDLMLAAPRRYGRADYLPVIAWGQLAVRASRLEVGASVALEGRVQSRTYHKVTESGQTEERVAYEVSMMRMLDLEDFQDEAT